MKLTLNVSSSDHTKMIDLSTLPVTHVRKGEKALGVVLIIFALMFGGIPTMGLMASMMSGKFDPATLFVLVFTLIGIAMFVGGLNAIVGSTTMMFDARGVSVTKKTLFGTRQWSEKYAAYEGVLSRSEYHSGSKNSPSYTLYIVELRHADAKKTLRLYESRSDVVFRTVWEDYCRQLNMPAVEMDGAKLVKRDVADLDKSVRELVAEGKIRVEFDPSKPPPAELALRVDGDVLELTVVKKKLPLWGFAVALLVPGGFMYIGFFVKDAPVFLGIVGVVFLALVLLGYAWSFFGKDQIRVGKEEVLTRQVTPWGPTAGASVRCADVETVRIGREAGRGQDAVILETDAGEVKVGEGLSAESLEWLKNCIMRVIST